MRSSPLERWLRPVPACVALLTVAQAPVVHAVEPFDIADIRVEGLDRKSTRLNSSH